MERSPCEFKLPMEYRKHHILDPNVEEDLHFHSGETTILASLYEPRDDGDKLHFEKYSHLFSTEVKFLKDTQKAIAGRLPDRVDAELPGGFFESTDKQSFLSKYGYFTFSFLSFLNASRSIMLMMTIYATVCPILALLLPIVILIIPFLILKIRRQAITFATYLPLLQAYLRRHSLRGIFDIGSASWDRRAQILLTLGLYILQLYLNAEACYEHFNNMGVIHRDIDATRDYLRQTTRSMENLGNAWRRRKTYKPFLAQVKDVELKCRKLLHTLERVLPYKASLTKGLNLGETMCAWHELNTSEELVDLISYCRNYNCYVDNLISLKRKIKQSGLGRAQYADRTELTGTWLPCVATGDPVSNDINLDSNLIITGPNASGKTTLAKSLLVNVILSQQIGYGYYRSATINPYDKVHSYINIPDTNASDSLFQAEAGRCKSILDACGEDRTLHHLCIFDELFSGTNPTEAIGAATAFLEYIGSRGNVEFLLTTHYKELCKLGGNVRTKKMEVLLDSGGIVPTYKLLDGVSEVDGGLQVLADLGFPDELVERAREEVRS